MELIVVAPEGQLPRVALFPVIGTVDPAQGFGLHVFVVIVQEPVEEEQEGVPEEPEVKLGAQSNVQAAAP